MSAGSDSDSDKSAGSDSDMSAGSDSDMSAGSDSDMSAGSDSDMSAGSDSDMSAGSLRGCYNEDAVADGECDDFNNNEVCSWDGGDCCGPNVNTYWRTRCECLDPAYNEISRCVNQ